MNKNLRPIMFVGTGSDVGKSIVNAAFCRIFLQDGFHPAPFKAQNMSLNSYATPDGLEIGRAQAVQAEACGIPCSVEMNPVLLKPTSNQTSQVVLNGKPIGNQTASEYFLHSDRDTLFAQAMKAYSTLAEKFNPIVIEGAGSISEINLKKRDITNMRVALQTKAATYLIADIDRGGVFGSVYGTIMLLEPEERALIKGIIINKFRGDVNLFLDGKKMLEELTGIPVVSIIPYYKDIFIDDEDSVVLDKKHGVLSKNKTNIVVVLLKHMSNFTDFNVLERYPDIHLFYSNEEADILNADIVIIPGSKNTVSDMQYLRKSGLAKAIITAYEQGNSVYGICGGYQMMGTEINDPYHVESDIECIAGLGILPVTTTLTKEKITEQSIFQFQNNPEECKGYEIHMGETTTENPSPLCFIKGKNADGYLLHAKTWGTYMHGIFDNTVVIKNIIETIGKKTTHEFNPETFKEEQYNKLADMVRAHSDMNYIYQTITPE
jgi:adenosylcobyric acid synthase